MSGPQPPPVILLAPSNPNIKRSPLACFLGFPYSLGQPFHGGLHQRPRGRVRVSAQAVGAVIAASITTTIHRILPLSSSSERYGNACNSFEDLLSAEQFPARDRPKSGSVVVILGACAQWPSSCPPSPSGAPGNGRCRPQPTAAGAPVFEIPAAGLRPGVGQGVDAGPVRWGSLWRRREERRRSPGNGLRFSSGCHGPPNSGGHGFNLAQDPLCFIRFSWVLAVLHTKEADFIGHDLTADGAAKAVSYGYHSFLLTYNRTFMGRLATRWMYEILTGGR